MKLSPNKVIGYPDIMCVFHFLNLVCFMLLTSFLAVYFCFITFTNLIVYTKGLTYICSRPLLTLYSCASNLSPVYRLTSNNHSNHFIRLVARDGQMFVSTNKWVSETAYQKVYTHLLCIIHHLKTEKIKQTYLYDSPLNLFDLPMMCIA